MVAAALAVSGCGGGGGGAPTPPGGTTATQDTANVAAVVKAITDTEIAAAGTAVGKVMNDSPEATVTAARAAVAAAKAKINDADIPDANKERLRAALARHEGELKSKTEMRADAMTKEAEAVHAGIARYDDTDDVPTRRHAAFSDNEEDPLDKDATLDISIGKADIVSLERDKDAMVAALKGWTGSRYTLESGGATYEAVVYDNRYSAPGDPFHIAWRDKLGAYNQYLTPLAAAAKPGACGTESSRQRRSCWSLASRRL